MFVVTLICSTFIFFSNSDLTEELTINDLLDEILFFTKVCTIKVTCLSNSSFEVRSNSIPLVIADKQLYTFNGSFLHFIAINGFSELM